MNMTNSNYSYYFYLYLLYWISVIGYYYYYLIMLIPSNRADIVLQGIGTRIWEAIDHSYGYSECYLFSIIERLPSCCPPDECSYCYRLHNQSCSHFHEWMTWEYSNEIPTLDIPSYNGSSSNVGQRIYRIGYK